MSKFRTIVAIEDRRLQGAVFEALRKRGACPESLCHDELVLVKADQNAFIILNVGGETEKLIETVRGLVQTWEASSEYDVIILTYTPGSLSDKNLFRLWHTAPEGVVIAGAYDQFGPQRVERTKMEVLAFWERLDFSRPKGTASS